MTTTKSDLLKIKPQAHHFFEGMGLLFKGLRAAFKDKTLFVLCLVPGILTAFFLYFFFSKGFSWLLSLAESFAVHPESYKFWMGWLVLYVVKAALKILVFLFSVLASYLLLQVVSMPICGLLAERVLSQKGILRSQSFMEMLQFNFNMLKVSFLKALVLGFLGIMIFLSSFFPIFSLLPLYFGFLVLAYDSFDFGLELYGLSLKERKDFFGTAVLYIHGHALVLFFISFVPGLILLTLPYTIVGASLKLGEINES